jgi:hypothetical protein
MAKKMIGRRVRSSTPRKIKNKVYHKRFAPKVFATNGRGKEANPGADDPWRNDMGGETGRYLRWIGED